MEGSGAYIVTGRPEAVHPTCRQYNRARLFMAVMVVGCRDPGV